MAANCIGRNNYKCFILFLGLAFLFASTSLLMTVLSIWFYFMSEMTIWIKVYAILQLVHNAGCTYYSYSMCKWYYSMALKNIHSVEETMIG